MDRDDLSTLLTQSAAGEEVEIDEDSFRSIFGHGEHALDGRAERDAGQFAEEHNCDFIFDPASRQCRFIKRRSPAR